MKITNRATKEIGIAELKEAITSGRGPDLVNTFDEIEITLTNGETVTAVCAGYVTPTRARFALKNAIGEPAPMNRNGGNRGGYLKSEGRAHVLNDLLPLFPEELREAFAPHYFTEEIDGEKCDYADTLFLPRMTDLFGPGPWWQDEETCFQIPAFKRERDRIIESGDWGTFPAWTSSVSAGYSNDFCNIYTDGTPTTHGAYRSLAFAPHFEL